MSVNQAVDLLEASKRLRNGNSSKSKELLDMMALSGDWYLTALIDRSISDGKQHVTLRINGINGQFHLKVDKTGLLYDSSYFLVQSLYTNPVFSSFPLAGFAFWPRNL